MYKNMDISSIRLRQGSHSRLERHRTGRDDKSLLWQGAPKGHLEGDLSRQLKDELRKDAYSRSVHGILALIFKIMITWWSISKRVDLHSSRNNEDAKNAMELGATLQENEFLS
jgi:hypothetical protein